MIVRYQQPSQAPADHTEVLREAVDDECAGFELEHGMRGTDIAQTVIDLVRDDFDVSVTTHSRDCTELVGTDDGTRGICRTRDDHATRRRIDGGKTLRGELES